MTMWTRGREAKRRCKRIQDGCEEFLPGIPNDITLYEIVPKLSWKTFYVLALVNRVWLQAIRYRQVYNARHLSHSLQTCAILANKSNTVKLCLSPYTEDHDFRGTLPLVPYCYKESRWVCLDGRIYLLGGQESKLQRKKYQRELSYCRQIRSKPLTINKVLVLDVAGQRQWKECASMNESKIRFGCGVMNGKIYVFGRTSNKSSEGTFSRAEVYDPDKDSWAWIKPMPALLADYQVLAVGDELFVCEAFLHGEKRPPYPKVNVFHIYNPAKGEWRVQTLRSLRPSNRFLFVAKGKLYSMGFYTIYRYDAQDNEWILLHSFSILENAPYVSRLAVPDNMTIRGVQVINDELVLSVSWTIRRDICPNYVTIDTDLRSIGFGCNTISIKWLESQFSAREGPIPHSSNRLIEL